ncbi:alpha/beta hydrolase [Roseibium sp.]|uniref:alpha/beta fold hydrolase n=1 Tax=Roseibium sp. TaxID=1936156 RepID=UPI00326586FA
MTEPLVLVPGLQSDASSWLPLMERLGLHFPLIVPRGHQFSPSIAEMAETVARQSPDRFHLTGWSMGGYIAFEILRRWPERLISLTLIATTAAPETPDSRIRRRDALDRARHQGLRDYQTVNLKNCLFDPEKYDRERLEAMVQASETLGYEALAIQTRAIMARPDSRSSLAACACPLTILAGAEDQIISVRHSREMHALVPNSQLHIIPDCGHCPPIEYPDLVAEKLTARLGAIENNDDAQLSLAQEAQS